ncbi:hypothetical protein [Microbacterium murale]|uniref:DUF222 domain-containing protein n=1 Tax=Microbacterium murale TaxID=1081040 RepID=A0ABU0P7I9_9MICO|nr:hypothetical protein [Microbacterium murale]MDQ0642624.1 hypothetical protein [Microbacterium murale]
MKLILDPLIIRPVQNPQLAGFSLASDAAAELTLRIASARDDLVATAAWFQILKRTRRALRITEGNPQEKYFQRCFELARTLGVPEPATAEATASEVVSEIAHAGGDAIMTRIRALLQDPVETERLQSALSLAWKTRASVHAGADTAPQVTAVLDDCGSARTPELDELIDARAGTAAASQLESAGAARTLGLTALDQPTTPGLGATASKRTLPRPFDRSVFERLFAALSGGAALDSAREADDVVEDEIERTASAWELADEQSRIIMLLGAEASHALEPTEILRPTNAHRLLSSRWEREAYVRRVLRLPGELSGVPEPVRDDIRTVRQGYLRRLWVRLHGRELRGQSTTGAELWDTLDGALRSVVMDQRHRLKLAIGRDVEGAA